MSDRKAGKWLGRVRARLSRRPKATQAQTTTDGEVLGVADRPSSTPHDGTSVKPSGPALQPGGGWVVPAEHCHVPKQDSNRKSWPILSRTKNPPGSATPRTTPQGQGSGQTGASKPAPAPASQPEGASKPSAKSSPFSFKKVASTLKPLKDDSPNTFTQRKPNPPTPAEVAKLSPPKPFKPPPEPTAYKALADWQPDKYVFVPDPSVPQPDYSHPAGRRPSYYGSSNSDTYGSYTATRSSVGLYSSGGAYYESSDVWTAPSDISSTNKMSHYFSPPVKSMNYDKPRTCHRCLGALDGSLGDRCTCR